MNNNKFFLEVRRDSYYFNVYGVPDHNIILVAPSLSSQKNVWVLDLRTTKIEYESKQRVINFTDGSTRLRLNLICADDHNNVNQLILWQQEVLQKKEDPKSMSDDLAILKKENTGQKEQIKQLEDLNDKLNKELYKLEYSSSKRRNNTEKDQELKITQQKLESSDKQLKKAETKLRISQSKMELAQLQLDSSQLELTKVKNNHATVQQQIQAIEEKNEVIQAELKSTKAQLSSNQESLRLLQAKNDQLEKKNQESIAQISALSVSHAKLSGMHVDDRVHTCSNMFRELRDNDLLNLVFNLTADETMQDVLFPLFAKLAFHNFWSVVCADDKVTQEFKIKSSQQILATDEITYKCADNLANAAIDSLKNYNFKNSEELYPPLINFFASCTKWHANMTLCEPSLELLPKNHVPKRGTLLNNVFGQQFDLDFGELGYPSVDSVIMPGLMVHDFNGTILVRAQLKCFFPSKKQ